MTTSTVLEVQKAIIRVLQTIKVSNGYNNDLPDDHIHIGWGAGSLISRNDDSLYPKAFVVIDEGETDLGVGQSVVHQYDFIVVVVVKQQSDTDNHHERIALYIEDLQNVFFRNPTLLDTVLQAKFAQFVTSNTMNDQEAAVTGRLETELRGLGNN